MKQIINFLIGTLAVVFIASVMLAAYLPFLVQISTEVLS